MIGTNAFSGKGWQLLGAATLAIALTAGSLGAYAQAPKKEAAPAPKAGAAGGDQAAQNQSAWVKLCEKAPVIVPGKDGKEESVEKNICLTHHERLDASTGMVLISAAVRDIEGADKKHLMVMLPLGMAIPPGMQAGIYPADMWDKIQKNEKVDDSKIQPVKLQYTLCHAAGCTAEVEATADLLKTISDNAGMIVYAVNGNGAPIAFPVPLNGFKEALNGAPADNAEYATKRTALMKQIAENRKKMIEEYQKQNKDLQNMTGATPPPAAAPAAAPAAPPKKK